MHHKKELNIVTWDNMNGPKWYYDKWNKSDKFCIILLTFGFWKTNQTNKQKKSHKDREQKLEKGQKCNGDWEVQTSYKVKKL